MAYIHSISITNDLTYLIEPLLFATAGGTSTALTAEISNFSLVAGAYVNIKVGEVGANATLSIIYGNNLATDPKPIYYNNVLISADILTSGNIYTFVYDGIKWNVLGDITHSDLSSLSSSLGALAYKSSVSAQYVKATGATTGTAQKTSTGKFTPSGSIKINGEDTAYIKFSTTSVTPSNTANYWVYQPEGSISTDVSGGTTTSAYTSITAQTVVTTATTSTPSSTTAGTLMYALVSNHVLLLNQIKPTTGSAISDSATTTVVKTVGNISATFTGTTVYSANQSISASFSGTQDNVSVTGTFVDTVTITTANAYATITYPT